jgi:micrococcal nuclease
MTDDEAFADEAHDIGHEEIRDETKHPLFQVANMKSTIAVVVSILFIVLLAGFQTCLRQAPETEIVQIGNELETDNLSVANTNRQHVPTKTGQRFKVVRVIDGDTVQLATGESLRYIGINTPETKHPRKPVEYFGKEASAFNTKLVSGKDILVEFDVQKSDRYGRLLGYVFLLDGTFVNAELVKQGYAKVDTYPPNVRYSEVFRRLQAEAIKQGRGLWQKEKPGRIRDKKQKSEFELPFQKRRMRYAQFNPNRYRCSVRG